MKNSSKAAKRYIWIVVALSVVLAAFVIPAMIYNINEQLVLELSVDETDITNYTDGVYSGSFSSSHLSATVDVSVAAGQITGITLTDYTGIDADRAKQVADCVVIYQMLNVPDDDIGSQPTDIIVLKAVEDALDPTHHASV